MAESTTSSSVTESMVTIWPPPLAGSVVLVCVWVVGMTGNSIIIFTFLRSRHLRKPPNMFYVNLAIADFGFNIFAAFLSINMLVHDGARPFGDTTCFTQAFLLGIPVAASFDCIGPIAISRYIVIVHPSKKKYMTWRFCVGVCLFCWIPPILLMMPNVTGWSRFKWHPRQYHCTFDWGYNMAHDVLVFALNYGIMSLIMLVCYIRIYMTYRRSKKRVASQSQGGIKGVKKEEFRLALQLLVLYALYNIFWTPISVLTVFADSQGTGPVWLYITVLVLCSCNSSINLFVYLYYNEKFRVVCMKQFGIKSNAVEACSSSGTRQSGNMSGNNPTLNTIS